MSELLTALRDAAADVGIDEGKTAQMIEVLCRDCGGSTYYLPALSRFQNESRNRAIRDAYQAGQRYAEIASRYKLTEVRIRQIVASRA